MAHGFRGVPKSHKGDPWDQNYSHNTRDNLPFGWCVDTCTDGTKTMVGKNAGALTWIKLVALNCLRSHWILHLLILTAKKNVPGEKVKFFSFIKSCPWIHFYKIVCVKKGEIHTKHFCYINDYLMEEQNTSETRWQAELAEHFVEHHFFSWQNDKQTMIIQTWVLDIF